MKTKTKNKVILFDLDGTILDTDMLIIRSYMHLFDTYRPDYKLKVEELLSFLGPVLKDVFPKYFKEDFNTLLKTYHGYSRKNIDRFVTLYDGVIEMLKTFKENNIKLGIVTNRFKYSVLEVIKPFDIQKYFDIIITLDDVTSGKPNPEGILKAIELLKCKKKDVIFIGDNNSDLSAGKNAGVKVGLVSWKIGTNNESLNPDILIKSYNEFLKGVIDGKY